MESPPKTDHTLSRSERARIAQRTAPTPALGEDSKYPPYKLPPNNTDNAEKPCKLDCKT